MNIPSPAREARREKNNTHLHKTRINPCYFYISDPAREARRGKNWGHFLQNPYKALQIPRILGSDRRGPEPRKCFQWVPGTPVLLNKKSSKSSTKKNSRRMGLTESSTEKTL